MVRTVSTVKMGAFSSLPRVVKAAIKSNKETPRWIAGNRACFRMPADEVAFQVPDSVCTVEDLKQHMCNIYDIPSSTSFRLRSWTTKGSTRKTVYYRGAELIIDLEDNHNRSNPLMFVFCLRDTADQKRQRKLVCGNCKFKDCDGLPLNLYDILTRVKLDEAYGEVSI